MLSFVFPLAFFLSLHYMESCVLAYVICYATIAGNKDECKVRNPFSCTVSPPLTLPERFSAIVSDSVRSNRIRRSLPTTSSRSCGHSWLRMGYSSPKCIHSLSKMSQKLRPVEINITRAAVSRRIRINTFAG